MKKVYIEMSVVSYYASDRSENIRRASIVHGRSVEAST